MPKLKSHRGTVKRFRKTKNRKVKRNKAGRRHLLSGKSSGRRRKLRKTAVCEPADTKRLLRLLGD